MLTLNNFQDMIDSSITQRGWRYFKDGLVHDLRQLDNIWTANVYGSYEYNVEVTINPDSSVSATCDCPYDRGSYCKHMVAVLYSIRGDMQGDIPVVEKEKRSASELRHVVEGLSYTELVEIVMQQVKKDRLLGNQLLLQYTKTPPDKQTYSTIIGMAIDSHSDRGILDYMGSMRAGRAVSEVIGQAVAQIEARQPAKAIPILQAVIETVAPVLGHADDSSGDLAATLGEAIDLLQSAAQALPADEKHAVFTYTLQEAFEERHRGFGNNWTLLHVACEIATSQDRAVFFGACDRMVVTVTKRFESISVYPPINNDDWHHRYTQERVQRLKQTFMQRAGDSPQAIEAFLSEYKYLHDSRRQLIQLYIEQERYTEAQDLCHEGIEATKDTGYLGLVMQYHGLLLTIARKQGNTQTIITLAEQLFVKSANFEHYETLKAFIPKAEWSQYVENLISNLSPKYRDWGSSVIGEIYRREAMWERLRDYVVANGIHALEAFRTDMEKYFPDDAIAIYKEAVYNGLKQTSNRYVYREMTDYLRRIKLLGQPDTAYAVAADLKRHYNNRPAMIDTLNQL